MEGTQFQESNKAEIDTPNLTNENLQERVDRFVEFIDIFAQEMGENFANDRKYLHLSLPGWQTIGVIFHDVNFRLNSSEPEKVARALARIDWSRSGKLWTDLMVKRELKDGGTELVLNSAGASTKREMVKRIREELKIDVLLAEIEHAGDHETLAAGEEALSQNGQAA